MLKADTQGALVDACQAVKQYSTGELQQPWQAVEALVDRAMALVGRDEREPDTTKPRKMNNIAKLVLDALKQSEWVGAASLKQITHRFGDGIYTLRKNNYSVNARKEPRCEYQYKLVRGPDWPGWAEGNPIAERSEPVEREV